MLLTRLTEGDPSHLIHKLYSHCLHLPCPDIIIHTDKPDPVYFENY